MITDQQAFDALMRENFSQFARKTFRTVSPGSPYLHNWHVDLIAEYLEACYKREIRRLIINIPPRFMKSILTTIAFPAWLLGKDPSTRIIAASFSKELSLAHSVDCRLVVESEWYQRAFPMTIIAGDQNTKGKFQTTKRGMRFATSVEASVTGVGGDFLIVDDPHDPKRADSPKLRLRALNWYSQTFSTRANDPKTAVRIVIMQRLHEMDLSGDLASRGGWEICKVPLIAEKPTTIIFPLSKKKIERKEGDLLHDQRIGKQEIETIKKEMTSAAFAQQYQQTPAPSDGGIFDIRWFKQYRSLEHIPEGDRTIIQSWDTASKEQEINDPSCCTTWIRTPEGLYLINVLVKRMNFPKLRATVITHAEEWNADLLLIEDKSSGTQLIQQLISESFRKPIVPVIPVKDKIMRANTVSPMVENGMVHLPKDADWLDKYLNEMLLFPNGEFDDQVDSTTQMLSYASKARERTIRVTSI